jgi:hypothetical protein
MHSLHIINVNNFSYDIRVFILKTIKPHWFVCLFVSQ